MITYNNYIINEYLHDINHVLNRILQYLDENKENLDNYDIKNYNLCLELYEHTKTIHNKISEWKWENWKKN